MSNRRERARQQWEQEIRARQQNVTPADYPEGLHYARAACIPKIISQWRFWLGIALIAVGVSVFSSSIPAGVAGIAAWLVHYYHSNAVEQ
jgi:hypothetical protein